MATNPYFTQLHTQRFSFIGSPQQRDGTYLKDQRFLNLYPELIKSPITDGKKYYLKKRPGVALLASFSPNVGQGIFYWAANNTYYYAIGGVLYYGPSLTPLITLSQSANPVGFCEFRGAAGIFLVVVDGAKGWTIGTANTFVQITDVNFPNPHVPQPIYLDGYIFLAAQSSQTIHNSNLDDPNTWPSDGFIDAEMYPDNVVMLAKAQNYLVAIGTESVEFFYDNANATGSPLQRNAPAVSQFGTPAPYTVNQTERQVIMVGQTGNGGRTVWMIDGFQPKEIASAPVREALDLEGASLQLASAFTIQSSGHKWYVLTLQNAGRTLVFDFEEEMWHEWSSNLSQQRFAWRFATDNPNGGPTLMNFSTGQIGVLDPGTFTDCTPTGTSPINCVATTSKIDFDTIKRKRFYRLTLTTDSPNGDTLVPITVYWSDDDYNTWSNGTALQIGGMYPTITQLGYSRRRSFKFVYQQPYPLRMESFEVDITQEVRR